MEKDEIKNLIGITKVIDIPTKELFDVLSRKVLFEARWGFTRGNLSEDEYKRIIDNKAVPALENLIAQEKQNPLIECKAVYGFFACKREGNKITVFNSNNKEIIFDFPRQEKEPHLCIADFIRQPSDVVPFFVVTLGNKIIDAEKKLFEDNSYYNYHLLHGLGAELADCGAVCVHKIISDIFYKNQSYSKPKGKRYSFGYPSCPELSYQKNLFDLLEPSKIGLSLTQNYQMVPELSVSGFILFDEKACYFIP
ncbi:MAG: hypothetical protein II961_09595 [Candidatus Riflebacteria bacterium]|nr:hypothetical protein [Candidatus Riflebacteria bacterium]